MVFAETSCPTLHQLKETEMHPRVRDSVIPRGIEAVESILMSLISLSYDHPLASFTSILSASRSFLFGNDRGSLILKNFPTRQISTITRPPGQQITLTGATRVRPGGENGPRCNLRPFLLQLDSTLFFWVSPFITGYWIERRLNFRGLPLSGALESC